MYAAFDDTTSLWTEPESQNDMHNQSVIARSHRVLGASENLLPIVSVHTGHSYCISDNSQVLRDCTSQQIEFTDAGQHVINPETGLLEWEAIASEKCNIN